MNRVNVNPNEKQRESDVFTLTNVVTGESVALIPSDSSGNFSWSGITKAPIQRNAMQTSATSGEWSDLDYPWMALPQEEWGGGRANLRFSIDKSRYYDSVRAQTAFNKCIYNAPLDYYSEFDRARKAYTNCPASLEWRMIAGYSSHVRMPIQIDNLSIAELYIHLRRKGNPTVGLTVELYTESEENSENIIASHVYNAEEIVDITSEFRKFLFTPTLISDTVYLEIFSENNDPDNYWEIGMTKNDAGSASESYDGKKWKSIQYDILYRLDSADEGYRTKFFMYEQLMFCIRQKPNETPRLYINGDIGRVTAVRNRAIGTTGKDWTENAYVGARIGLVYGKGIEGQVSVWRTIVSNTNNQIVVDQPFDVMPDSTTEYIIVDTPLWTELTGHSLTATVTDIHVIRGVVYFCQGDYVDVVKMRWHDGDIEWKTLTDIKASFLQSVRDSTAMMLYRGRNDGIDHKRTIERALLLDWDDPRELVVPFEEIESESEGGETEPANEPIGADAGKVYGNTTDFELPDGDSKQYVIDITVTRDEKNIGSALITLQQSEDNSAFKDVQSITVYESGRYYINAHCDQRYRRLSVQIAGVTEGYTVDSLSCETSDIPHFESPIYLLDNYGKITRLFEYGAEQEKSLWIFQEGMVSSINKTGTVNINYNHDRVDLDELQVTADEWNGSAVGTSDVYLMWSWLNGLQRIYNTQVEGKGPDHDEGMPKNMQGRITAICAYPGSFFVSIDAEDGYSSIMMYNGSGWHNLYRAPNEGEKIFDIAFQPIYGPRPDRLWAQVGDNIIWLAMPSKILYAIQDPNAEYTHESVVVSSWITGGMAEVDKLWQSLSIMSEYLDGKTCWIEADYQLDDEKIWHPLRNRYVQSPHQEENFASENESVNGKKLRYRLRLQTSNMYKTPKVDVVLIKAIGRVDLKYSYGFHFRNIKHKFDLMGEYEEIEPYELDELLTEWANKLATLRLNSVYKLFDNKRVFLDGTTTNVVYEKSEGYLSQITLTEI